ncbi:unnamed protein product [Amoebophrya sp. A120]|nr:unnamed protein product [Amoebophrya sp. A120]|eukprot:GSA120T00013009001.1
MALKLAARGDYGSFSHADRTKWVHEHMDERLRQSFAQKVLGLTAGMLSVTASVCMLFKVVFHFYLKHPPDDLAHGAKPAENSRDAKWLQDVGSALFLNAEATENFTRLQVRWMEDTMGAFRIPITVLGICGSLYALWLLCCVRCCCSELLRRSPTNYVLLYTLGVMYGLTVNTVTLLAPMCDIGLALGGTAGVLIGLYCVAKCTSVDVTGMRFWVWLVGYLLIFSLAIFLLPLVFIGQFRVIGFVINVLALLMISVYLVADFQMIVGGKHFSLMTFKESIYKARHLLLLLPLPSGEARQSGIIGLQVLGLQKLLSDDRHRGRRCASSAPDA